ncbi:hypothetical protein NEISICOT_01899 [Neisseria sicca ATCC 29256]|uniref:Uncharacterized protein n=1 Tax=Neisseria sicca ATCC 29256 TaxID=547045 RepID=C6M5V0_NEISI|nr:hypothetical protein NEISICOT_01899 [Neisseria sicca ATCC 29256]
MGTESGKHSRILPNLTHLYDKGRLKTCHRLSASFEPSRYV